jgi:dTDP-4-dehydrorhamnose reductase
MRILLLGNTGQLGWELQRSLATLGEINACDYPDLNLSNPDGFVRLFRDCQPDLLVNATAYTAVDHAEEEPDLAHAINALAPGVMAEEALRKSAAFIHYSTDYVFNGHKGASYLESDLPAPLSIYGHTKLAGEQAIQQVGGAYMILRTSWVYSLRRPSFVSKVLGWAHQQEIIKLVDDQVSGPTWARMLAEATSQLIYLGKAHLASWFQEHHGLYHLAGAGYCSRYEWGRTILEFDPHKEEQRVHQILPAHTSEFPTRALRPLFSALNCDLFSQTFHLELPDWKFALKLAMEAA